MNGSMKKIKSVLVNTVNQKGQFISVTRYLTFAEAIADFHGITDVDGLAQLLNEAIVGFQAEQAWELFEEVSRGDDANLPN